MRFGDRSPPSFGPLDTHPFKSRFFPLWFTSTGERDAFDRGIAEWLEKKFGISLPMEE